MVSLRIATFLGLCACAWAQADQPLTFEVASIQPAPASDQETKWGHEPGGRFSARAMTPTGLGGSDRRRPYHRSIIAALSEDLLPYIKISRSSVLFILTLDVLESTGFQAVVSLRFRDLHGPVIAFPCVQGVAQQFLNFWPLPQGQ